MARSSSVKTTNPLITPTPAAAESSNCWPTWSLTQTAPGRPLPPRYGPTSPTKQPARNLRVNITFLQRLLEPDRTDTEQPYFIRSTANLLQLTGGEWLDVDVWQFDQLIDQAEQAERDGTPSRALAAYKQALPLYRGDYLSDLPDVGWAELDRDRLRLRYQSAATRAGELLLASGDTTAPLTWAQAALRRDPTPSGPTAYWPPPTWPAQTTPRPAAACNAAKQCWTPSAPTRNPKPRCCSAGLAQPPTRPAPDATSPSPGSTATPTPRLAVPEPTRVLCCFFLVREGSRRGCRSDRVGCGSPGCR